jgi:hypothetical protein
MSSKPMGLKILAVIVIMTTLMAGCAAPSAAAPTAAPTNEPPAAPTAAPTIDLAPTLSMAKTQAVQTYAADLAQSAPTATSVPPTATLPPLQPTPAPTSTIAPQVALATATNPPVAYTPYSTPTLTTYSCGLISVSPGLKDRIKVGTSFMGTWRVENTGTEYWQGTEVDVHYISGEKFQTGASVYDLGRTVGPTGSYTFNVNMKAPAYAGPYYTQWAIKFGQITICTLNMTVYVVN